jgi:hypothetical protein
MIYSKFIKNKKKRERVELYESLLLGATIDFIDQKLSIVSEKDEHTALLRMGKYYSKLQDAVGKQL